MELEGQIEEVGLSDVFQLLKMSSQTGVLKVSWGRHAGGVYFRDGRIEYAHSTLSGAPLGQRLVKAGELHQGALNAVLAEQLDADAVVMESCLRVDEWSLAMPSVGSLEKVPYLTPNGAANVSLSRREWVRRLLELPDKVPVLVTGLREPEETAAVIAALTELIP